MKDNKSGGRRNYNKKNEAVSKTNNKKGKRQYHDQVARKSHKIRTAVLIVCLVLVLIAASGVIAYKALVKAPTIPSADSNNSNKDSSNVVDAPDDDITVVGDRSDRRYTILICGTDVVADNTDTIMVVSYDVDNQKANVVSIPRDTLINVSWNIKKINAAYAVGGIDQLKSELKKLLGFSIDYYILVDKEAVVQLVNAIDGVDFYVPVDMYYSDPLQDLYISIPKGQQHLSGEDAYKVMRFRASYVDGDIGRINTQQQLLMALAEQTFTLSNLTKVDEFVSIFNEYVLTDLTMGEIAWFAQNAMSLSSENIQFMTLPGNYNDTVKGLSYVTVYIDELLDMVNAYLNPYDTAVTAENLDVVTRDANGNLYATTGSIRGGIESFGNYGGNSGNTTVTNPQPSVDPVEPSPSENSAEPTDPTTTPTDPTATPTDPTATPTDPTTTPTDPTTTPTDPTTTPTDPATTPTDPATTPTDPATTPTVPPEMQGEIT